MEPIGSFQTVSGRGILRSSAKRRSRKFDCEIMGIALALSDRGYAELRPYVLGMAP